MRKFFGFLFTSVLTFMVVGFVPAFALDTSDCKDGYIPGSQCPCPSAGSASICGQVTSPTPRKVDPKDPLSGTTWAKPVRNVDVLLSECNPESPTCKTFGMVTRPYSSRLTNDQGFYHLLGRKVGGNQIRYLSFWCDGTLSESWRVPSFVNIVNFNVNVECSDTLVGSPAPLVYDPIKRSVPFSCDMNTASSGGNVSFPVSYGTKPASNSDFRSDIRAFDARFTPDDSLGTAKILFAATSGWYSNGSWVKEDCSENATRDLTGQCASTGDFTTYPDLITYANAKLPASSLPAYKPVSIRFDMTGYSQDPLAPVRMNAVMFGNPLGVPCLRRDGSPDVCKYPKCEIFKTSKYALNTGKGSNGSWQNYKTTTGFGAGLSSPNMHKQAYLTSAALDTVVCRDPVKGEVKIGEIKPPFLNCERGEEGCDFVLDDEYWWDGFLYFYGIKGSSAVLPHTVSGRYDSFEADKADSVVSPMDINGYTPDLTATQVSTLPFTPGEEADRAGSIGTSPVFSGGDKINNNSPVSTLGLMGTFGETDSDFSRILVPEKMTDLDLQQGVLAENLSLVRLGENSTNYCLFSSANTDKIARTVLNEKEIYKDTLFEGNADHYVDEPKYGTPASTLDGTATGGTMIYYTQAAKDRDLILSANPGLRQLVTDAHDNLTTATYGDGKVNALSLDLNTFKSLQNIILQRNTANTTKNFGDRGTDVGLGSEPAIMNNLNATFNLMPGVPTEEFYNVFSKDAGHYTGSGGSYTTNKWGSDSCSLQAALEGNDASCCYPWQGGTDSFTRTVREGFVPFGESCRTGFGVNVGGDDTISPTCGVAECAILTAKTTVSWTCSAATVSACESCDPNDDDFRCEMTCAQLIKNIKPTLSTNFVRTGTCTNDLVGTADDDFRKICAVGKTSTMGSLALGETCTGLNCDLDALKEDVSGVAGQIVCTTKAGVCRKNKNGSMSCKKNNSTVEVPGCRMMQAGPFGGKGRWAQCSGSITKYPSVSVTQEPYTGQSQGTMALDDLIVADNYMVRAFSPLSDERSGKAYTYKSASFVDTKTSVMTSDSRTARGSEMETGVGASATSQLIQMFAPKSLTAGSPNFAGRELLYHCNNDALMPKGKVSDWDCPIYTTPDPEIVDLNSLAVEPSCSLKLSPTCTSALGITGTYSKTFTRVVEAAASRFNVPAAALLIHLKYLNNLDEGAYYWTENVAEGELALLNASAPWYGTFWNNCDNVNNSIQGPFDFTKSAFKDALAKPTNGAGNALDEIALGRADSASRCNFLDNAYVSAARLQTPQTSCSAVTFADIVPFLKEITLDSDKKSPVDRENFFKSGSIAEQIFNACK